MQIGDSGQDRPANEGSGPGFSTSTTLYRVQLISQNRILKYFGSLVPADFMSSHFLKDPLYINVGR